MHVASRTANSCLIVALEKKASRFEVLKRNLEFHQCTSTLALNVDPTLLKSSELLLDISAKAHRDIRGFHRIILDPPCSGFGKRPDLLPTMPNAQFSRLQKKLLFLAWDLLLPSGILVYSTCSILPNENEAVIASFLESRDDVVVESLKCSRGAPGLQMMKNSELEKCKRFIPIERDLIGFFIAKLRKI
jgi:16S rRNA C967 or C1407 C5-methylase (RsmB/RsmF family)